MNYRKTIIVLLILLFTISCASIKIGLFRGAWKIFGGKIYKSRFIALNDPKFISSTEVDYLRDEEEVIGIFFNSVAKAYPLTMSFYHHIFNDEIGGKKVLVTFCPLTHTAMVFDPVLEEQTALNFTVEGGLKESNMIMIDDVTQSKWIQITFNSIKGELEGRNLDLLFSLHTTWENWKTLHPNTLVLSRDTGFDYDYSQFPFQEKYFRYKKTSHFLFKVSHQDDRYHPKEIIFVIKIRDISKVYPFSKLDNKGVLKDTLANTPIVIFYDKSIETIAAFSPILNEDFLDFYVEEDSNFVKYKDATYNSSWNLEGMAYEGPCEKRYLTPIPSFKAFWFAWIAFYPETLVYNSD